MNEEPKVDTEDTQELAPVGVVDEAPAGAFAAVPRRVDGEYGRFMIVEASLGDLIEVSAGNDLYHELVGVPMKPAQVEALIARLQTVLAEFTPKPDPEAELSAALAAYLEAAAAYRKLAQEWAIPELTRHTIGRYNQMTDAKAAWHDAEKRLGDLFPRDGILELDTPILAVRLDGQTYMVEAKPGLWTDGYQITVVSPGAQP